MGRELTLVGLVDDKQISELHDLGDTPLMPLLSPPNAEQQSSAGQEASGTASLDPAASAADTMPGVVPARPVEVAMVPTGIATSMTGAHLSRAGGEIRWRSVTGDEPGQFARHRRHW